MGFSLKVINTHLPLSVSLVLSWAWTCPDNKLIASHWTVLLKGIFLSLNLSSQVTNCYCLPTNVLVLTENSASWRTPQSWANRDSWSLHLQLPYVGPLLHLWLCKKVLLFPSDDVHSDTFQVYFSCSKNLSWHSSKYCIFHMVSSEGMVLCWGRNFPFLSMCFIEEMNFTSLSMQGKGGVGRR